MKSFIALLVIFSIISIAYGAHHLNEGLAYTPLNEPGLDVQGGFKGLDSHDHLFYCDIGAARENFASDSDYYESCATLKREVHPFLPVTVASTGEGKPIVFFASNEETESVDGSAHPMKYVICDDASCSSFSEPQVLEGFNGKHALSYDHMWVSGKRILVLGGTGRFFANPKPSPNTYALQYAFCTSESCDAFVSKEFVQSVPAIQATLLTPKVVSISVYGPKYHQKVAFYYTSNSRYEIVSQDGISSNFKENLGWFEIGVPISTFPITHDANRPFGDQYDQNQAGLPMSNILDVDYTALVRCNNPPNCDDDDLEVDFLYSGGSNIAYKHSDRTPFNTVFNPNFKRFLNDLTDEEEQLADQTLFNFEYGKGVPRWTVATLPNPSLIVGTTQGLWVGLINYKNQKFTQAQIVNPNSRLNKEVFWGYGTDWVDNNKKRDFDDEAFNHGEYEESLYNSETPSDTGSYLTFIPCGLDGTGCRMSAHLKPYQFDEDYGQDIDPTDGVATWNPLIEQVAYPIPDPHLGWSFAGSRHNWHSGSDNSEWIESNGGTDENLYTLPTDGYNQVFSPFAAGAAGNGFPASVGVVSDESNEPSAAGWSIVLSVCLSETCDQQVYRYLMDSSALHDNWGTLDDPFSAANEIINHPDGSWTIVLFVQPNSELSNGVDWVKNAFDGDELNYFDGTTTIPTTSASSTSTTTQPTPPTDTTTETTQWSTSSTAPYVPKTLTSTVPDSVVARNIEARTPPNPVSQQEIGNVTYSEDLSAQSYLHISNSAHGSTGKPLFIHCLDDTCSEASISTSSPDLLGSKVPIDVGAYRDILSFSGFTLDPVHDAKLIRVNSNRPHSYAFVGENHEYLLVSVRDIDPESAVGHTITGSSESGNLYPSLRFYSTNRYSSPNGQPCSHDNVGTHVVSDGRTYICTRLFIGNNHQVSGISGWVKYYEWVDAGASLATRIFPNIPSGSYNIFDELENDDNQLPNHFLYPENIASATAYLKNPNDPLSENTDINDLPSCRGNCGDIVTIASQNWCSCACNCDSLNIGCCPDIAQYCPAEVSSGIPDSAPLSDSCEFQYGEWLNP